MRNAPALFSVLLGLLASLSLPAAVVYAERDVDLELLWAGAAVPLALVLGVLALVSARAGRRRADLRLRERGGALLAGVGRLLGLLGILLAGTGAIALLVYLILTYRGRT